MEKITFGTNVPETVALKYPTGREVPSQNPAWPPQMMFTLADDRRMYLPIAVGEIINGLGLQPMTEFIVICAVEVKRGMTRTREYQVRRLNESTPAAASCCGSAPEYHGPGIGAHQWQRPRHPGRAKAARKPGCQRQRVLGWRLEWRELPRGERQRPRAGAGVRRPDRAG